MIRSDPSKWFVLVMLAGAAAAGCNHAASQPPPPKPAEVHVALPVTRDITDYEDFTGRTAAVYSIDVRARVTGYLEKANFKEGSEVKKDDVLFEIDPRPYQAELDRAEANLVQAQAHLDRLNKDYERAQRLVGRQAMGREEYDKVLGDRNEANAAVAVAKAARDLAKLNLEYTKVTASIAGRISHRMIDPGNMVKADDTILTSIVSLDPVHAYFDVDERRLLRFRRLIREGKIKAIEDGQVPVQMGLADEEGYPHEGTIDFMDNRLDAGTGSLWLRGVFPNPKRILAPGLFVRVRVPIGQAYQALLVSEQALGTDQGQKFVYVVNDQDSIVYRPVKIGGLHDGLRVITDGLTTGEKVVVSGLQRVRPGVEVEAKVVDMPVRSGK